MRRSTPHEKPVWIEKRRHSNVSCAMTMAVHEFVALVYFTSGQATMAHRAQQYDVRAGDVLLVPAGEPHRRLSSKDCATWGIGFCASCYAPSELATVLDPFERARAGASAVVHIPGDRQAHLELLCAELQRETSAPPSTRPHLELAQKNLLSLILLEVSRAASVTPGVDLQPSVVGDALRFIERNCLRSISLREVAAAVNKSPAYVTTVMKRTTGKTAVEWIIAARLSEARNRLLHSDEHVDIIAERIGYADATHFIRLFRREHGVTPAAWRADQRRGLST